MRVLDMGQQVCDACETDNVSCGVVIIDGDSTITLCEEHGDVARAVLHDLDASDSLSNIKIVSPDCPSAECISCGFSQHTSDMLIAGCDGRACWLCEDCAGILGDVLGSMVREKARKK